MADRGRRARTRQISEITEDFSEQSASESEHDWDQRRTDSARRAGKNEPLTNISRTKRGGDDKHQSIRLTMKVAPSKLREVTRANEVDSLQDTLGGGRVIDGPRSRRAAATTARANVRAAARPRYAEYGESEIEEDEEGEDEDEDEAGDDDDDDEEDEDAEADNEEATNDFDELGAEAEGGTDDEDIEMEDVPPLQPSRKQQHLPEPPKITLKPPPISESRHGKKSKIIVTPAQVGPLKSVEDQEMEDDPGDDEVDEELSDLSEDDEDNEDDDEEEDEEDEEEEEGEEGGEEEDATNLNDEDAEGEEELLIRPRIEGEEELDEDDDLDDDDSGDETPASGMATPDPNRLTKRQRGRPEDQGQLMALDMAPQQRKFFTDEEKAMKKDEHARKRKELTKRKITEEKTAALNRLLKPQASKARGAAPKPETLAAATAAAAIEEYEYVEKANPLYTRWISTKDGIRLAVPEDWLGKRVGKVFGPPLPARNGALIQEIE